MPDELRSSQVLKALGAKYDVRTDREGLAAVADVFLPHELGRGPTGQRGYKPHHIEVLGGLWNLSRELRIPMRGLLVLATSPVALEQVTALAHQAARAQALAAEAARAQARVSAVDVDDDTTEEVHAIAS